MSKQNVNQVDQFVALQEKSLEVLLGMATEAGVELEDTTNKTYVINQLIQSGVSISNEGEPVVEEDTGGIKAGVLFALGLRSKATDPEGYAADSEFIREAKDRIFKNQSAGKTTSALLKNKEGKHYMRTLPAVRITKEETLNHVWDLATAASPEQEEYLTRVKKNPKAYTHYMVRVQRSLPEGTPRQRYQPGQQRDPSQPLSSYIMYFCKEVIQNPVEETM